MWEVVMRKSVLLVILLIFGSFLWANQPPRRVPPEYRKMFLAPFASISGTGIPNACGPWFKPTPTKVPERVDFSFIWFPSDTGSWEGVRREDSLVIIDQSLGENELVAERFLWRNGGRHLHVFRMNGKNYEKGKLCLPDEYAW